MVTGHNGHKGTALIYCRVSTRSQEQEGTSLDSQEQRCREKAEELGYEVGRVTREVYTGAELWDRPQLSRDRADLKAGKFQVLIAYDHDRLSRDPIHFGIIVQECARIGVDLVLVNAPLDTSPEGMLIHYVKGYAAAMEREKIRERSMRGKRQRLESGKLPRAGADLYGYRRNEDGSHRDIYEPEAVIVRQIFHWFTVARLSMRRIVDRLNEQGVATPTAGKRTPYKRRALSGQAWNHATIHRILEEPAYKGQTVFGRWHQVNGRTVSRPTDEWIHLPDGLTPAIVPIELWDAAERRLQDNRGRSIATRNEYRPFLLRGLIFCAICGRPMRAHTAKAYGRRTYRCSSREHGGAPCGAKSVAADDAARPRTRPRDGAGRFLEIDGDARARIDKRPGIEPWVWERVAAVLRDPSIIARELERQEQQGPDPVLSSDLETAQRALRRIERQQDRLLQQFSQAEDDAFPWELVKDQISRLEREKHQHELVIADLERRLADQRHTQAQLASLTAYCARVARNLDAFGFEEKRLALEALNVRVLANGREWSLSGSFPIEQEAGSMGGILETSS